MWNSKRYAAMAVLGAGLAVAAATPASACWPGAYGNAGGCGAYGYAGGCGYGAYGYAPAYAGVYSYGWPYGSVGYGGCGAYGYVPAYGYAGGCGYGASSYAPAYGAYGYVPAYYGNGCRTRHLHGHGGYALAYAPRSSYRGQYYAAASNSNFSARRHFASIKQVARGG